MKGNAFLDTNVAIMWANGDPALSVKIIESITRHPKAFISSLTIAEVEIKALIKKLPNSLVIRDALEEAGIQIESFSEAAAEQLPRFPSLIGHDPFDRLILAQASVHRNSTLYTTDKKLADLGLDWVVHVAK